MVIVVKWPLIAKTESPASASNYRGMQLSLRSYEPDANFTSDLKVYIAEIEQRLANDSSASRTDNLFSPNESDFYRQV